MGCILPLCFKCPFAAHRIGTKNAAKLTAWYRFDVSTKPHRSDLGGKCVHTRAPAPLEKMVQSVPLALDNNSGVTVLPRQDQDLFRCIECAASLVLSPNWVSTERRGISLKFQGRNGPERKRVPTKKKARPDVSRGFVVLFAASDLYLRWNLSRLSQPVEQQQHNQLPPSEELRRKRKRKMF